MKNMEFHVFSLILLVLLMVMRILRHPRGRSCIYRWRGGGGATAGPNKSQTLPHRSIKRSPTMGLSKIYSVSNGRLT
jgi:hypothetical protein